LNMVSEADMNAKIRKAQERFDELCARIAENYAEVPMEEGMAEIDALVAEERARWKSDRNAARTSSPRTS